MKPRQIVTASLCFFTFSLKIQRLCNFSAYLLHGCAEALTRVQRFQHRIALADAHGSADLFGDDNTAQVVPLCQVGAKKFYKLSEKPLISMALGFPDGATMHLRGFDRLCYFRSKFDRFAPKGNIGVNSQLRCFHRCRFSIR